MVDVGDKPVTARRAVAQGEIRMQPETLEKIRGSGVAKGDALAVARIAGIQAAKRWDELIPLCQGLAVDCVKVDFELGRGLRGVRITSSVSE